MKVYCISFQQVLKERSTNATANVLFQRFRKLDGNKYVFLTSHLDKDYGSNIIGMSSFLWVLYKAFDKFFSLLKIPYYVQRTLQEKFVDYHSLRILKKEKHPVLLICAMYSVKCTRYVKEHGGKVIFYAGNLNDELYYDVVNQEKQRLGLSYTDIYSSSFRINVYRQMFKNIDAVWCLNSLSAWSFKGNEIILNKNTKKRANIIYPKQYGDVIPDKISVGYFGHTTLLKGVHLLPEAVNLCKHKDDISFVVAGSVDNYVKEIINRYDVRLTFLGSVPEDKKWSTIHSFDFMIIPSLYDAGPSTITEAFKCDVPVIVSSGCGGVERIQNDPKTIVFNTMDVISLAEKLDYAYEHRAEYLRPTEIRQNEEQAITEKESLSPFIDTIETFLK